MLSLNIRSLTASTKSLTTHIPIHRLTLRNMTGAAGLLSNRYRFDEIPDQSGKTAIVTGGSAGIGYNIALGLALAGARVIIASSRDDHGQEAVTSITSQIKQKNVGEPQFAAGSVEHYKLDLGHLSEVQGFADKMLSDLAVGKEGKGKGGLNYLVCIAGVGVAPGGETQDGLGNHFAVNHLSHFLLTTSLLPLLSETRDQPGAKTGDVRIVTMSSELHRTAPSDVKFETLEEVNDEERDANALYAGSKLMGILFTKQLVARKLHPSGDKIIAIATHPGAVATGQQKGAEEAYGILGTALKVASKALFMSPEQGSESALWAATSPKVGEDVGKYQGAYLRQPDDSPGSESKQAMDEKLAVGLWELSRKALKEQLGKEVPY